MVEVQWGDNLCLFLFLDSATTKTYVRQPQVNLFDRGKSVILDIEIDALAIRSLWFISLGGDIDVFCMRERAWAKYSVSNQ